VRRFWLALVCFWRVLLGRPLPPEVLALPAPPSPAAAPAAAPAKARAAEEGGAIALLALLQRDGRLVDFLLEDIDGYTDDKVGAAVRDVHRGCRKALLEHFDFEPVLKKEEGARVTVERGFDAAAIRLTGAVAGEPPFSGTLRHPGWKVRRAELPGRADGVVAPAEVEL
jgi:hypothetical protein